MRRLTDITPFSRRALFLPCILILLIPNAAAAQEGATAPVPKKDDVQERIHRARALAAAHKLESAARELENVRAGTKDDVVQHVTSVMLVGIYVEDGNYARAEALLDETFRVEAGKRDGLPKYYALAGQAMNSVRLHLHRYRTFGVNITDGSLPNEAVADLSRLRVMLERMVVQAKALTRNNPGAYDALSLLEDVSAMRLMLARDEKDRSEWEGEYSTARNALAASHTEIASIGGIPAGNRISEKGVTSTRKREDERISDSLSAVSVGLLNHRATKRVFPVYPQLARNAGISGIVRVHVTLDETGKVSSINRTEGPVSLKLEAENAARGWEFSPTIVNGAAVRATGHIEFNFRL